MLLSTLALCLGAIGPCPPEPPDQLPPGWEPRVAVNRDGTLTHTIGWLGPIGDDDDRFKQGVIWFNLRDWPLRLPRLPEIWQQLVTGYQAGLRPTDPPPDAVYAVGPDDIRFGSFYEGVIILWPVVSGWVFDCNGQPIAGVHIETEPPIGEAWTDVQGYYELHVPPALPGPME